MEDERSLFPSRYRSAPPSDDGFIVVEVSNRPVPYHIARCFNGVVSEDQSEALALSSCRISCMATDVARGRLPMSALRRSATSQCIDRIATLSTLLRRTHGEEMSGGSLAGMLPVIPQSLNGMMLTPHRIEMAVHLTIGASHHWTNLILQHMGSRWLCVMADIG